MKKFLVVMVVALLALALVACGGEEATTTKGDTTTPVVGDTTTTPAGDETTPGGDETTTPGGDETSTPGGDETSTPGGDETSTPGGDETSTPGGDETSTPDTTVEEPEGIDLLWDYDYMAIADIGNKFCMFEDSHASLDNNVALVISMNEAGGVYNELFLIDTENPDTNANWEANLDYRWVVTIEGREIEVQRFSLFNNNTSGWVRIDLGPDFKYSDFEYDENNEYTYNEIRIDIYNSDREVVYFANLTDPDLWGGYVHIKPDEVVMIVDTNRPENLVAFDKKNVTLLSGPTSTNYEGPEQLFDDKLMTKLCMNANGEENAVIFRYSEILSVAGFSFVNAGDNASFNGRTIVAFDLYGSSDGENWESIYSATGTDAEGNAIDKAGISANYAERFYALDNVAEYQYFKLVANNGEMWQASEFVLWTEN